MNINVHFKREGKKKTIETTGPSQTLQQKTLVLCWHQTLYKTSTGIYPHADDFLLKPTNRQEQQTNPYRHFQCFMVPYCWVIELWLVRRGLLIMVPHRWVYPIKMNCSPWTWIRGFQQQAQSSRTCCSYNSIRWSTHFSHQNTKYLKEEIDLVKLEF